MKLWLLAIAALVGCATLPARDLPNATVVVSNQHWLDQVVYANCGVSVRVGVAGGLRETTLRLPAPCLDRMVSFATDPIGSNSISRSDALAIVVGDRVALQIPAVANGYLFLSR